MARTTRADVARLAGVSPSTVSVVLNGRSSQLQISAATQKRVLDAAATLRYIPQASARGLRTRKSRTIGLVLGQLPEDPYAPVVRDVLITAISTCASRGYFVLPIPEPADVNASFPFVRSLLGEVDLAGVICETTSKQRFLGQLLDEVDVPVMWMSLVEKPDDFHGSGHIRIDEQAGVRELVSNIDISGDATALMLTGPNLDYSRHKPFMNKFGSQVRQINLPDWTSATAQKTVSQILKNETNIGLIWAVDDPLAVGALAACEEARIAVPDQIQIAGFGPQSDPTAQLAGITSVDWPLQQMTELAVTNLIESLSGKAPATNPVVDLATKAVWRKTTR